ncbi:hypothetical protein BDZ91DRAFT_214567 [Kalaharituber pfeilii]|nr:hypothetical protein BDZ91DRAFT_214567 [Kalaharituber pfeilii]
MNISLIFLESSVDNVRIATSFIKRSIKESLSSSVQPAAASTSTPAATPAAALTSTSSSSSGVQPTRQSMSSQQANRTNGDEAGTRAQKGSFLDRLKGPVKRVALFLNLRSGKPSASVDVAGQRPKRTLAALFFELPTELQLGIVGHLQVYDIIRLRQTNRSFRNLIQDHESYIVKQHVKLWVPKYILLLFPIPMEPRLQYLEEITYKQRIALQLAVYLAEQIVKEMSQRSNIRRKSTLSPQAMAYVVEQLRLGMSPLILALYHFLETYRVRKEQKLKDDQQASSLEGEPEATGDIHIQSDILFQYPDCLLLQVHQMYHLMVHLLFRRLTPQPMWLWRTPLWRWHHTPFGPNRPTDETFAKVLLIGGIPEVWKLYRIKGNGRRGRELEKYIKKVDAQLKPSSISSTHASETDKTISITIDELSNIWVPAAEKQLLGRGIVGNLADIRCCGQFVAELLGDGELSSTGTLRSDDGDTEDGTVANTTTANWIAGLQYVGYSSNLADDGYWDNDLIEEEEDVEEHNGEGFHCEEPHGKPTSLPNPGEGSSKAPVPTGYKAMGISSSPIAHGYHGMGGGFMSIIS